jgi:hypothetical protein
VIKTWWVQRRMRRTSLRLARIDGEIKGIVDMAEMTRLVPTSHRDRFIKLQGEQTRLRKQLELDVLS